MRRLDPARMPVLKLSTAQQVNLMYQVMVVRVLSCLSGGYDKVPQNLQNQTVDVQGTGELKQKQPWTVGGLLRKAWT